MYSPDATPRSVIINRLDAVQAFIEAVCDDEELRPWREIRAGREAAEASGLRIHDANRAVDELLARPLMRTWDAERN